MILNSRNLSLLPHDQARASVLSVHFARSTRTPLRGQGCLLCPKLGLVNDSLGPRLGLPMRDEAFRQGHFPTGGALPSAFPRGPEHWRTCIAERIVHTSQEIHLADWPYSINDPIEIRDKGQGTRYQCPEVECSPGTTPFLFEGTYSSGG